MLGRRSIWLLLILTSTLGMLSLFLHAGRSVSAETPRPPNSASDPQPIASQTDFTLFPERIKAVGHVGGWARAVAKDFNLVYAGLGVEFAVLDFENSAEPQRLDYAILKDHVLDIAIFDNGRSANAFVVADDFYTFDITGTGSISQQNKAELFDVPQSVEIIEDRLLLLETNVFYPHFNRSYVTHFQISDTGVLSELGRTEISGHATDMLYAGEFAFVSNESDSLDVFRIAPDTTAPILRNRIPLQGLVKTSELNWPHVYAIHTDCPVGCLHTISVIDMSVDPPQVVNASTFNAEFDSAEYYSNTLILSSQNQGVGTVSIEDGTKLGSLNLIPTVDSAQMVLVDESELLVADMRGGIHQFDLADPLAPTLQTTFKSLGELHDFVIDGDTIYLADETNGIHLYDISDPTAITPISELALAGEPSGLTLNGTELFVASGSAGVHRVSVGDVATPTLIASIDTDGYSLATAIDGTEILLADRGGGLKVIDWADPINPAVTNSWYRPNGIKDVTVADGKAYAIETLVGMVVFDVSGPNNLTELGRYPTVWDGQSIEIEGDTVYLTDEWEDIHIVDVSNPITPTRIAKPLLPGRSYGVEHINNLFFNANWTIGFSIIDLSNPEFATTYTRYDTPGFIGDVQVVGDKIFALDVTEGLFVFEASYNISGTVRQPDGTPFSGATIDFSTGDQTVSAENGTYGLRDYDATSITITPSHPHYRFDPPSRQLNLPASPLNQDFAIYPLTDTATATPGMTTTLQFTDTRGLLTAIHIPSDTISTTTTFVLSPTYGAAAFEISGTHYLPIGHGFSLQAFAGDGTLLPDLMVSAENAFQASVAYADDQVGFAPERNLTLARWDGAAWVPSTCQPPLIDTAANVANFALCETGEFAVFVEIRPIYLPIVRR